MQKRKAKTAEQKARQLRAVKLNMIRKMIIQGKEARAYAFCKRHGYDIFEARLAKEYNSPAENWFVAKEAELKVIAAGGVPGIKLPTSSIFSPEVAALVDPAPAATLTQEPTQNVVNAVEMAPVEEAVAVEIAPEPFVSPETVLGWPVECDAVVWGQPRNPNMVIALLPDNRKASLWQSRFRKLKIHDKVRIKLEDSFLSGERQGDPIYVDCSVRANVW